MSPTYIFNKIHDFQKGIKCTIMLYPIFKDDWQCDNWYHEKHTIASVHSTEAVFDPHYSSTKTPQVLLWEGIKHFVFSVFCKNQQTSVGHMLIKHHSDSRDAQLVTRELHSHYENFIYAQTHPQDICANLANLHIATWKGTFQDFHIHWAS